MSGRLTAVSGFLHGLFSSQSPGRASPKAEEREEEAMMESTGAPRAGPSSGSSPYKLPILPDADKENDSFMYGVELDTSAAAGPSNAIRLTGENNGRSIASSGFHGTPRQQPTRSRREPPQSNASIKGKERARDVPRHKAVHPVTDELFQPVRTYKCPPADRPLYTLDKVKRTITIHATDADPSYWPTRLEKKRTVAELNPAPYNQNGGELVSSPTKKVDWHEPVIKDTKQFLTWQQKCGHGLAKLLELPEPETWTLAAWPKGYKMFFKHSYEGQYSFFVYIVGSTFLGTRRFKTAKEFSKHMYWLCMFGDDIHARCQCRFCVREFDREGKPRTAIIQRVVNVPYSGDEPLAKKKIKKLIPTAREDGNIVEDGLVPEFQARVPAPYGSVGLQELRTATTSLGDLRARAPGLNTTAAALAHRGSTKSSTSQLPSTAGPTVDVDMEPAGIPEDTAKSPADLVNSSSRRGRASSSFASAAGEVLSKLFGLASPSTSSAPPIKTQTDNETVQKKGRGRPLGSTAAAIAARTQPVVEIETLKTVQIATSTSTAPASIAMSADGSTLGKRKRSVPVPNYYIETLQEVEAAEERALAEAAATAALNATLHGANGRAIRSTRNFKSMKEASPPPVRVVSGPMYTGPFIHRKRHDDLKIHSAPYREHEIVWYRLGERHICPVNDRLRITHWPGQVIAKTLRIETHHIEIVEMEDVNGDKFHIPQPVNAQFYVYSIELLGVGTSTIVECRVDELLPWVAYAVPDILKSPQTRSLLVKSDNPLQTLELHEDFKQVLTTWVWVRHWANAIQSHFSPFGFFQDPETSKKLRRKRRGYNNGSKKNKTTRAERDAREKEMLRETEMIASHVQFYQGVWFGAEKLWVGDMARVAGTYEKSSKEQEYANAAYVQLYAGRTRRDGKGQLVKLDGYSLSEGSAGEPAFFQITHIYRVPGDDGSPGTLTFDGTFYELIEEEGDPWNAEKRPPSLYGDMQGVLDTSDSSSTDQDYVIDPITGAKKLDCSIPSMYRRTLMPPAPSGYRFKPLQRCDGAADDETVAGMPAFMLAGRYYDSGVLFPDSGDVQSRKLVKSCSGKAFRPETTMGPIYWTQNRRTMIRGSKRRATRDTSNFFAEREQRERNERQQEKIRQERRAAGDWEEDSDDGPTVSTSRAPANSISKQTTVTIDDDDAEDSDVIMVATSRASRG